MKVETLSIWSLFICDYGMGQISILIILKLWSRSLEIANFFWALILGWNNWLKGQVRLGQESLKCSKTIDICTLKPLISNCSQITLASLDQVRVRTRQTNLNMFFKKSQINISCIWIDASKPIYFYWTIFVVAFPTVLESWKQRW